MNSGLFEPAGLLIHSDRTPSFTASSPAWVMAVLRAVISTSNGG